MKKQYIKILIYLHIFICRFSPSEYLSTFVTFLVPSVFWEDLGVLMLTLTNSIVKCSKVKIEVFLYQSNLNEISFPYMDLESLFNCQGIKQLLKHCKSLNSWVRGAACPREKANSTNPHFYAALPYAILPSFKVGRSRNLLWPTWKLNLWWWIGCLVGWDIYEAWHWITCCDELLYQTLPRQTLPRQTLPRLHLGMLMVALATCM